ARSREMPTIHSIKSWIENYELPLCLYVHSRLGNLPVVVFFMCFDEMVNPGHNKESDQHCREKQEKEHCQSASPANLLRLNCAEPDPLKDAGQSQNNSSNKTEGFQPRHSEGK